MRMHLKAIEMENFKSFAKKVRIPFLEGYTAITGPNGAGKSNITDAVLFVLGPKSSRVIRAGRLTDLIYNGGRRGRPAKFTQVSLLFDNSDRTIPIDADEVELTRLVKVSPTVPGGYNSYFYVNGRKSALNEFDNLLAHARISADGHNIVQQGDVSRIVTMGNVERRRILESIAGITKFDEEIAKAEKEREEVDANLSRIAIILDELRKQLGQLERDRAGALKYKELKEQRDRAQAQIAWKNMEMMERQVTATREQVAKYEAEIGKLTQRKAGLAKELVEAREALAVLEDEIAEKGGEAATKLKRNLDALKIERARAQDGIESAKDEIRRLKKERRQYAKDLENVRTALASDREKAQELTVELAAMDSRIEDLRGKLNGVEEQASQSDSRVLDIQKEIVAVSKRIEEAEEELHKLKLAKSGRQEAIEKIVSELAEAEEDLKSHEFELKDAQWQLKELRTASKTSEKSLKERKRKRDSIRAELDELDTQSQELQAAILRLTREYEALKAQAEAAEAVKKGYSRAVSAVLEARDKGDLKGVHGTVAELLHVEPKLGTAISVAAGSRMQAIVVDDDGVAAEAIQRIKKGRFGRAMFLPLNKMLGRRPRGKALLAMKESLGFAVDLVEFDDEYRDAMSYVFGDTLVVDSLDTARRLMGGVRLVTLEGELIEASGAMVGGILPKGGVKFGAPSRGEVENKAAELRKAREESEAVQARIGELKVALSSLEDGLRDLEGTGETSAVRTEAAEAKVKEYRVKVKRAKAKVDALKRKVADEKEALPEIEAGMADWVQKLKAARAEREAIRKRLLSSTPQSLSREIKRLQREKTEALEARSALTADVEGLKAKIQVAGERQKELEKTVAERDERINDHKASIEKFHSSIAQVETELRALQKMEASWDKEMREVRDRRDAAYNRQADLEREVDKVQHRIETKEDFLLGLKTELGVQEGKLAEATKEIEELDVDLDGEVPPLEVLRRSVSEAEAQMESLGAVNLKALEDFDAQSERRRVLKEEYQHLKAQERKLIRLEEEVTARKREGLLEVFHEINENFKEVFQELSDGGEAELILEKEEDPFEGGLIIKARPQHKRTLRLEALSGGEKSLVSMALIFAIQRYDPSPFYLLDEIDQNLDAINAEKVAQMIRANSTAAQFIQISLRKVTLKEADHIVGATMDNRGLSEIVMQVDLHDLAEETDEPPAEVAA
jgi:chromosome segregation protein